MKRIVFIVLASLCTLLGFIGIFVPVLPTTPLLLLAAFLFSRSSQRLNDWLVQTRPYQAYVQPFKDSGGIPIRRKAYILTLSYAVMAVSAFLVQRWYVWLVLAAVAVWLAYLMCIRIPTVEAGGERDAEDVPEADPCRDSTDAS